MQTTVQATSIAGENWLFNQDPTLTTSRSVIGGFTRRLPANISRRTSVSSDQTVMIDTNKADRGLLTRRRCQHLEPDRFHRAAQLLPDQCGSIT